MSSRLRIAFVYPPFRHKPFNENLFVVDADFGRFPNLGLAYAAAVARRWGAECRVWDAMAEGTSLDRAIDEIAAWRPSLLAFCVHSVQVFWDTFAWLAPIRARIGVPVLVGGYELANFTDEILHHPEIDFAVLGDAPRVLPGFLDAFSNGKGMDEIPGIAFRRGGDLAVRPMLDEPTPFDNYPFPARDLFPNHLYYSHVSQRRLFTIMVSSRGCPYPCRFCSVRKTPYNPRSASNTADEIESCYRDLGVREIDFFDSLMLHDRARAIAIAEEILSRGIDVFWSCRARVDEVDEEMLGLLARSGLKRIFYGIESGDEGVLKGFSKGIRLSEVREVIRRTAAAGVRPLGFFQFGGPGDTRETCLATLRFAKSLPLDYAQFQMTIGKPGSALEKEVNRALGVEYWKEYVLGRRPEQRLPTPWTALTHEEVEKLAKWAYLSFFARPRIVWRTLGHARSLGEVARYFKVGLHMAFRPLDAFLTRLASWFGAKSAVRPEAASKGNGKMPKPETAAAETSPSFTAPPSPAPPASPASPAKPDAGESHPLA